MFISFLNFVYCIFSFAGTKQQSAEHLMNSEKQPDGLMEKIHEAEHLKYIISLLTQLSSVLVYCNTELHCEAENTDSSLQVYNIIRRI